MWQMPNWQLKEWEEFAHIVAIACGGIWVLLFSGKVFGPRLEMAISGSTFREGEKEFLVAVISAKNVGYGDLKIDEKKSGLDVFALPVVGAKFSPSEDAIALSDFHWGESIAAVPALPGNPLIKSAETVRNELLFLLPPNQTLVKLSVAIIKKRYPISWEKTQWKESTVVRVGSEKVRKETS